MKHDVALLTSEVAIKREIESASQP
eukprot:SAG31_NODE_13729_length_851_cov_0.724734_1_plen_24_part_10